eukprot:TRINITY_DN3468_c0_g1_i1.p1 TRINITY_DN3468_c0_g1~~TRINITY_DN3468_c0_g1_i1.p1  ORF type:complete len:325 (+),score=62.34 TRINITY_DN3468_c0_g1_i1:88-1062(+)
MAPKHFTSLRATAIPFYCLFVSLALSLEDGTLPGWLGETHRSIAGGVGGSTGSGLVRGSVDWSPPKSRVIQLSWRPRAFLYKNFLTAEECDHLISLARPKLSRSTVVGEGGSVQNDIRTSYGMFIDKEHDDTVNTIEKKVAAWTFLPIENQEAMQVLRYNFGQKYESHYDYYDVRDAQPGGRRYLTVLMYLSNVKKGGETVFPNSEPDKTFKDDTWSDCGKRGVAVKPKKGDALLFFSMKPDATPDPSSLHAGCPVIEGEKWSATKWIHEDAFDLPPRDPSVCVDENMECAHWASAGECQKNPDYMVGVGKTLGFCRKSCKVCD